MKDEDAVAKIVQATVKIATAALDHPDLSDEELERLCEIALCEPTPFAAKHKKATKEANGGTEAIASPKDRA